MNQTINIYPIIKDTLGVLKERQSDVLTKRFGLKSGEERTLESIGQEYGITRERVRQIEEQAFANLNKPNILRTLNPIFDAISSHLTDHGDLRKEGAFLEEDTDKLFTQKNKDINSKAALRFLLVFGKPFLRFPENAEFHSIWAIKKFSASFVKKVINRLVADIRSSSRPLKEEEIISMLKKEVISFLKDNYSIKIAYSYLGISREIGRNIYGEYGLNSWPEINPRGMKDKAYLVLKRFQKPLHFSEITKMITESGFSKKSAHLQTVHNELIKDNRFVLVGRGLYALSEWGYEPGTVSEILVKILEKSGKPMDDKNILEKALEQRQVKENTVLLNLNNKNYFQKLPDGRYTLVS